MFGGSFICGTLRPMQWAKQKQPGFTIVELLIVIVVIAILAAITIVAYNGIQNRARSVAVQSATNQVTKAIHSFAVTNGDLYPTSLSSCPTPVAGALCVKESDKFSYSVSGDRKNFCVSKTEANVSYTGTDKGDVTSGSCAPSSCYAIQQAGNSTGSGIYMIQPSGGSAMQVYCDMVTSGGGWTLIVNNIGPSTAWNSGNITNLNSGAPSLTANYSIFHQANNIKSYLNNKLQYRIDAEALGRWGGVWEAPYSSSLYATSPQEVATLIEQYDAWTLDTNATDANGTQALSNVVPWVSSGSSPGIVTWGGTGNWWGTIATWGSGWTPAPYINGAKPNPGTIRYWVK